MQVLLRSAGDTGTRIRVLVDQVPLKIAGDTGTRGRALAHAVNGKKTNLPLKMVTAYHVIRERQCLSPERVPEAQVSTSTTTIDLTRNKVVREPQMGSTVTAGPRSNFEDSVQAAGERTATGTEHIL